MAHPTLTDWTCSSCQAKFESSDVLRKHITRNHNGRLAVCYGEPKLQGAHEQIEIPPLPPVAPVNAAPAPKATSSNEPNFPLTIQTKQIRCAGGHSESAPSVT